jgi:hypothetical protein
MVIFLMVILVMAILMVVFFMASANVLAISD